MGKFCFGGFLNFTFLNIFASCLTVRGHEALFHAHVDFCENTVLSGFDLRYRVLVLVLLFSLSFMGNGTFLLQLNNREIQRFCFR